MKPVKEWNYSACLSTEFGLLEVHQDSVAGDKWHFIIAFRRSDEYHIEDGFPDMVSTQLGAEKWLAEYRKGRQSQQEKAKLEKEQARSKSLRTYAIHAKMKNDTRRE